MKVVSCLLAAASAIGALAGPTEKRTAAGGPIVDVGYARYQGYQDPTSGLNVWKGVRYAAPPIGKLRWQSPQTPAKNRTQVTQATAQPPVCPQSGAAGTPAVYGFNSGPGDEDCLFLNVYAPPGAKNLPVFFWIHGGGYALFGATADPSPMTNANGNGFVSVIIQYRLGAFGFLSSDEVHKSGVVNAGLLDQNFALKWVQDHIGAFGGDPTRVTMGGESAGAGAAMLQAMAYGGNQPGPSLFENIIAASPYLPMQYNYNDADPTGKYHKFAALAGCANPSKSGYSSTFNCLVAADTTALQSASQAVSTSGEFGTFAFLPVTDGTFVQQRPSQQLLAKQVNGKRILSGNNANEGVPLSNPEVKTPAQFLNYVHTTFPLFTATDFQRLLDIYEYTPTPVDPSAPLFDTLGDSGPTALNQSEMATGLQQKVFDIFAETTFDCPSYWLAEAFSGGAKQSWKYQFSVTPSYHGFDLGAYFSSNASSPSKSIVHAVQKIYGSFIIHNTPVISIADATDNEANATVPHGGYGSTIDWPTYSAYNPTMMNLNTTGGTVTEVTVTPDLSFFVRTDPGVTNDFRLVNAGTWEGGRGARCDFWRSVSARVPE